MFGDPTTVAMVDDGTGGDVTAGDGLFTVTLPAGLAEPGQMIRWYVTARTRRCQHSVPVVRGSRKHEEYRGTIIDDPSAESNLPVFHWFVEDYQRAMNNAQGHAVRSSTMANSTTTSSLTFTASRLPAFQLARKA